MKIRPLLISELQLIRTIDRSEHISEQYIFIHGKLELRPNEIPVKGFDPNELERMIQNQIEILDSDGIIIGAFENKKLVGVVSVDSRLFGESREFAKMDILYVNATSRGKGIGKTLVQKAKTAAKTYGADRLYISATPTKKTIDFYLNLGAECLIEPDSDLFKLEPLDIHMQLLV